MKKICGKILHALATSLSYLFNFLINILNAMVTICEGISQFILLIGCSAMFALPLFFIAIPPQLFTILLILAIVPFLGKRFISLLRYGNFTLIEWMYDKADTLISGKKVGYDNISDYANKYKQDQERKRRRREEAQRQRQQEEINKQFEEFFRGFRFYDFSDESFRGFTGNQGSFNQGYGNNYGPNDLGFKEKYEKSCDTLGVDYKADQYQIKLAYRKLAKKYHPDISDDPHATEKFQEINKAYEYLSSDNIKKYQDLYKNV